MVETIGAVQEANLEISQGMALSFDIEWWDDSVPPQPIVITFVRAQINIGGTKHELQELGYATFSGNVATVALPGEWTMQLPAKLGKWRIGAKDSESGELIPLVRGIVKVRS